MRDWGLSRLLRALELPDTTTINARERGWGLTRLDPWQERLDVLAAAELERVREREVRRAARLRVLCSATTWKGAPCLLLSEPGRRRCKFYGGKSK